MDILLSICLGIGLSAATGLRVFAPLLIVSIAAQSGALMLSPSFEWIGTPPALIVFAVATLLEIGAYLIPWLDNALDTIATPAAAIAGVIVMAAVLTDISPLARWTLAIIAGGGAAATVQGLTVVTRAASTGTTGGCANPVFSILEAIGSFTLSILAIALPLIAGVVAAILIASAVKLGVRLFRRVPEESR
jgi:hypothetical protein